MWPFPSSTLSQIPLGSAGLSALCGIHINCVNILVVLFWCVYWLLDYMCVYLAICLPCQRERRMVPSIMIRRDSLSFQGLCFVALTRCRSKAETKQTEAVFLSHATTSDDERRGLKMKLLLKMVVNHNFVHDT